MQNAADPSFADGLSRMPAPTTEKTSGQDEPEVPFKIHVCYRAVSACVTMRTAPGTYWLQALPAAYFSDTLEAHRLKGRAYWA